MLAALLSLSVTTGFAAASNGEPDQLYREAVAARQAGDHERAIGLLEQAVAQRGDDVDALYLLGTIYSFEGRFDEALATLDRVLSLAPDYVEAELAIARVKAWRGDLAGAIADADRMLAVDPNNVDALNLRARLAYYQGDLIRAEAIFLEALERAPDNTESLVGLGDVAAASGDVDAARTYYERAAAIDPESAEIVARLERMIRPTSRWRLDSGFSYSAFSRESRKPWREGYTQLTHHVSPALRLHGRVEVSRRFDQTDTFSEIGVDGRLSEWFGGYLQAGGTPSAAFRPRWMVGGGGTIRIFEGAEEIGATLVTLDARHSRFTTGGVTMANPGVVQYLFDGRAWLTGRWINVFDESDNHLQGWLAQADVELSDRWRIYVGAAEAPQTNENVTVDVKSFSAGVIARITDRIDVRLDYVREDRERSYIRNAAGLGVSLWY